MKQKQKLPNIHPGEILQEEFLKPLDLSAYRLAKSLGVPATRIAEIVHGQRSITADTALRLGRFFSTSAKFWLGLQEDYDIEEQSKRHARVLSGIKPYASQNYVYAAKPK